MLFKLWEYFSGKTSDEETKAAQTIQKQCKVYLNRKHNERNELITSINNNFENSFDCIIFDDIGNPNMFHTNIYDEIETYSSEDDFAFYLAERKRIKDLSKKARRNNSSYTRTAKYTPNR